MARKFTLFVDESGHAGITKIRTENSGGASPYMTLGAALIDNNDREHLTSKIQELAKSMGRDKLHCSELTHFQKIYVARQVNELNTILFGVVSNKETLKGYKDTIDNDNKKYYNKCALYLLERVGWFMGHSNIPAHDLDIVFEKANFDYEKMKNFIRVCQRNPQYEMTKHLRNIDADSIFALSKNEEPLLEMADLVAHALYKSTDTSKDCCGISEPRYLFEILSSFFGNPSNGKISGAGIHFIHSIKDMRYDTATEDVITRSLSKWPH